ncbi:MAG TPA: hypothetical protein VGB15_05685 [Longimicrobium sp.]|jgi:hypothetical protein
MAEASTDATWDEHYRRWSDAVHTKRHDDAERLMQAARKRVNRNTPGDWQWLADALADDERKAFVAGVFRFQTVPGRLLGPMVRAAVMTRNPVAGRFFIAPCVRSLGARRVLELLLRYMETGTNQEKAGAVSALYYAYQNPRNEEVGGLWEQARCWMLRELVANPDLQVRQRIIPMLQLEPEAYPVDLRPLVPVAIDLARSHPDAYIRHRVEVQLGAGGLLMAIPNTGPDPVPGDPPPHPGPTADGDAGGGIRRLLRPFDALVRRMRGVVE